MSGYVTVTSITPIRVLAIPLTSFCGSLEVRPAVTRYVTLRNLAC